jgi:large subunit ribosomal protein L28
MIGESDYFFNVVVRRYLHIRDYLLLFDKLWIAACILALLLSEMPILWTGNAETHGNVTVKDKVEIKMARRCDICGKGTVAGNSVTRKGQAKKKGGVGQHIGVTVKRVFRPNLSNVKTLIDGTPRTIKVCMRCLRSNRVQKVV